MTPQEPLELNLTISAENRLCRDAARQVREFLMTCLSDPELLDDLELIVTEGLANAADHAYPGEEDGEAKVRVVMVPGAYVDIVISDWGQGLSQATMDTKSTPPPPESKRGRGLFLIQALADHVEVRNQGGRSDIVTRKNIKEAAWSCKPRGKGRA